MKIIKSDFSVIFIGAIVLCYVAFLNRFPVVYSDTGTYIYSGFENIVPWDRPIFYGLFIRHISLATSLWFVILAQGLLVSYTIFKTFDMFYSGNKRNILFIFSVIFLTVSTGISYNTSILLPDIFSAICILCFINILLNDKLSKIQMALFYLIFIYSMLVHFSNLLVILTVTLFILIYITIKKLKKHPVSFNIKKFGGIFIAVLSVLLIAPSVNYAFSKQFSLAKGSHVFIISHLLETGILEEYLNNECPHKNYKLCQYKDQLGWDFIWRSDSPFYKMGGADSTKDDYTRIIKDILTTPKYCKEVLLQSFEFSLIQFFTFDIPGNLVYREGSPPLSVINAYFKQYDRAFYSTMQCSKSLDDNLNFTKQLQRILVFFSLAVFICTVFTPTILHSLPNQLKWMSAIILILSCLNAAICSNLSTIDNRFQDRIIWLLPLVTIIIIEHLISTYLQKLRKNNISLIL